MRHKRINIGIAVALPDGGLMNVVARDADKTALGTLAAQNREMVARAREGKVRTDDVTDSTFSVSNLGPTRSRLPAIIDRRMRASWPSARRPRRGRAG